MFKNLKKIDVFAKNILIVFTGSTLVNFFNLLFQLLIAHKLTPADFASFNSLLSVFMIISAPLLTLQVALAKYSSELNAQDKLSKIKFLFSGLFKKLSIVSVITFIIFLVVSLHLVDALKIQQTSCAYILALLLALSWLIPLFIGVIQGLGLFGWFISAAVISGAIKLILSFILIILGYSISGALGALLISAVIGLFILIIPLRKFIDFRCAKEEIKYREIFFYLLPVAVTNLCFALLTTFDMVLVKYFFASFDSGIYSLGQMVGKIFLFLPAAVSIVMFPKTSGLKAKNMETVSTLRRSLFYVSSLCAIALLVYNFFPGFILPILTGKENSEAIFLGRLFGVSMSLFALLFTLLSYFLSIKDFRFIKYLVAATILQVLGISLFHPTLVVVQLILCLNAALLFLIALMLISKRKTE